MTQKEHGQHITDILSKESESNNPGNIAIQNPGNIAIESRNITIQNPTIQGI
jgi:hypothetical protein